MREFLLDLATAVFKVVDGARGPDLEKTVGMGASGSPTSRLDKLAEDVILEKVEAAGNPLNVLSEEHTYIDNGREETLIIDPVDGTYNALRGIPSYSVSLAIGRGDLRGIRYGLIKELVRGEVYYAERGKGAWLDGRPLRTKTWNPRESLFDLYLGHAAHPLALALARRSRRVRNLGAASLDMCLVARGAADLYLMATEDPLLRLRVTDIAASVLLVREAGGEVYDLDGNALNMPFDPRARANVLALGDPEILGEVLP